MNEASAIAPLELLRLTRQRLDAQRETRAIYAERLAPDFTPFEFMDTRETGLSRVLAWLLDPEGSHAQGPRFLLEFMRWLKLPDDWHELARCARVSTEVMTQFGERIGRIDILAVCGGRALAIENKPSAGDQDLQIARYLTDMAKRWPDAQHLLYLSGDGEGPSAASISERDRVAEEAAGRLAVRGYSALLEWLKACRAVCRAPSVALMLEAFGAHVERDFMGIEDTEAARSLALSVAASNEMLEAALALFESQAPLYAQLLETLVEQVTAEATRRKWFVNRADLSDQNYTMLVIGFSADAPVNFGLGFDMSNYRWLFYGMVSEGGRRIPPQLQSAVREVVGRGGSTKWWPVYRQVGPNDAFFPLQPDAGRDFWLMIQSGELARRLIDFVATIEAHLKKAKLLPLARG